MQTVQSHAPKWGWVEVVAEAAGEETLSREGGLTWLQEIEGIRWCL